LKDPVGDIRGAHTSFHGSSISGSLGNGMRIKARLFASGVVAHPRDSDGYRCGARLAWRKNPSLLFAHSVAK
jgi:hypothetical protein